MNYDIIYVGTGQSSIMGAYIALKANPKLKILFIDKGLMLDKRIEAVNTKNFKGLSPIIYGVGGAGAFSDCKFNLDHRVGGDIHIVTGKKIVDDTIKETLDIYRKLGCDVEPVSSTMNPMIDQIKKSCIENHVQLVDTETMHLGTDGARVLYTKFIDFFNSHNNVVFETEVEFLDIIKENDSIVGVIYKKGEEEIKAYATYVVIAIGRSGASKMESIAKKYSIDFNHGSVDVGVRVEIPDIIMKEINENFYEAKMVYYTQYYKDKMRTFCSNPSGFVALEKYDDGIVLANGHAYKNKKSVNTNLALLCTQSFTEPFNEPFEYAKSIARMTSMLTGGKILCQSYGDLKMGRRSTSERLSRLNIKPTLKDFVTGDISLACPKRILDNIMEFIEVHGKITPGFASSDLLLFFPEIKFRSIRVKINENMETSLSNLYVAGDSSGYGSGLNQAAVMGIIATRDILKKLS